MLNCAFCGLLDQKKNIKRHFQERLHFIIVVIVYEIESNDDDELMSSLLLDHIRLVAELRVML